MTNFLTRLAAFSAAILFSLALYAHDESDCACNPDPEPPGELSCLSFDGAPGQLGILRIPTNGPGRLAIGDLDGDDIPDYVVSRRHWMTAYNVCGEELWGTRNHANWDNMKKDGTPGHDVGHPYWNWSSFGWIGDANGDGTNEFLNIAADWRTLVIRDAATGNMEVTFDLGPGKWQYVMISQTSDGPRVIVTHKPGRLKVKSLNLRGGLNVEWSVDHNYRLTHYIPPQLGDINADGRADILHGSAAIDGRDGSLIWRHGLGSFGLGGAHTANLRQIDPDTDGLEAVFTVYSPKSSRDPSLVIVSPNGAIRKVMNRGRHAHQHTVGDFNTDVLGLETIARDHDGKSHYMADRRGRVISRGFRLNPRTLHARWGSDWGDDAGELIQAIDWDGHGANELLYVERHVSLKNIPMLAIHDLDRGRFLYRALHGGIEVARTDPKSLGWYGRVRSQYIGDDGPYEGAAHVVDVFGDGREEIIAMAHNQIVIYYNSGNAGVPKKWGDHPYMARKKMWTQVYNPR